jgi:hypothetical protein
MQCEIVNPVSRQGWDQMVLATGHHSVFHSSGWAEALVRSYSYHPRYFAVLEGEKLAALVPVMEVDSFITGRRGVSLTFSDYCEPIVGSPEQFHLLLQKVIGHGRKAGWSHVEFRGGQRFLENVPVHATYMGHKLELVPEEEQLLSLFRSSTRRNITKARLEGVVPWITEELKGMEEYYRLHCLTRKRHGLPPQPFQFFRNIHECIIARGHGFVSLASYQGKTVAGAVFFHFGTEALYKFGASDETFQQLRANNLVMWEAIRWYAAHRFSTFCFGRTDCDHTGLRQFKNGWGTKEKPIHYYRYDLGSETYVSGGERGRWTRFLEKAPPQMLKVLGQLLYRHMG